MSTIILRLTVNSGTSCCVKWGCSCNFFVAALCYAEMGCVIKASGADYAFLDAAFGSILSFVFTWCWAILLKPASIAALSLTSAQYILTPLFEDGCGHVPEANKKCLAIFILRKKNLDVVEIASSRISSVAVTSVVWVTPSTGVNSCTWRETVD